MVDPSLGVSAPSGPPAPPGTVPGTVDPGHQSSTNEVWLMTSPTQCPQGPGELCPSLGEVLALILCNSVRLGLGDRASVPFLNDVCSPHPFLPGPAVGGYTLIDSYLSEPLLAEHLRFCAPLFLAFLHRQHEEVGAFSIPF